MHTDYEKSRYKIDKRERQDLLHQLQALAQSYTPEWKFDLKNPDAASVIGIIFANQMTEGIKKLNQVLDNYHIAFANMYDTVLKPARPSKTVCTLKINENMQSGAAFKKGTQVIGVNAHGDEVIFSFRNDMYVTNAQITELYGISESAGKVFSYQNGVEALPLFSFDAPNQGMLRRQALILYFRRLPNLKEGIRLRFYGDMAPEKLSALFSDKSRFSFSFLSKDFEVALPVEEVTDRQGSILLKHAGSAPVNAILLELAAPAAETIALRRIELVTAGCEAKPDFLWNGRNELLENSFLPFTQQPSLYNEFYIGQEFCMEQYGAIAKLQFCLSFGTFQFKNPIAAEKDLSVIKRKPREAYNMPQYDCWIQEVTFDYFNGKGWKHLETDVDTASIFAKEENAGVYEINFTVPSDWQPVVQGGYEGNCIRMQVIRADYCYMQNIVFHYPMLSDMKVCLKETDKGSVPELVKSIQGAKEINVTEKVRAGSFFDAFVQLPYTGDYLFIGFDRNLGTGMVSIFIELDKQHFLLQSKPKLEFSYSCKRGFKPLKVIDGTNGLQNSGILMFIPPADMAAYEVEDQKQYWLRIEDIERSYAACKGSNPVLKNIYMNAVETENIVAGEEQDYYIEAVTANMRFPLYAENILSVEVWVNEKDQLSAEEIKYLQEQKDIRTRTEYNSLGEIEEFYILWHEIESFEDICIDNACIDERCYCVDRGTNELFFGDGVHVKVPHNINGIAFKVKAYCCNGAGANIKAYAIDRFRSSEIFVEEIKNPIDAYGGSNIENMDNALERAGNIFSSGRRMVSERDYVKEALLFSDTIEQVACVTEDSVIHLVLLMKDYDQGDYSFRSIQQELWQHFWNCCEMTCSPAELRIVEPVLVHISIDLWLIVPDLTRGMELRQHWLESIQQYLEPVKHKGAIGWQIGKLPSMKQIRLMLSALEKDAGIDKINVLASYTDGRVHYEMQLERVKKNPFMICCNGTHHIFLEQ